MADYLLENVDMYLNQNSNDYSFWVIEIFLLKIITLKDDYAKI